MQLTTSFRKKSFIISLLVFSFFAFTRIVVQAQTVLSREAICVERTYNEGDVVPADQFASLPECNSYLSSIINFYQDTPNLGNADPNLDTSCGEQGQFACMSGCDDGYEISGYGSCLAIASSTDQHIAFADCRRQGGTYEFCEGLTFDIELTMQNQEALTECIRAGGSPENCQRVCQGDDACVGSSQCPDNNNCGTAQAPAGHSSRSATKIGNCVNLIEEGYFQSSLWRTAGCSDLAYLNLWINGSSGTGAREYIYHFPANRASAYLREMQACKDGHRDNPSFNCLEYVTGRINHTLNGEDANGVSSTFLQGSRNVQTDAEVRAQQPPRPPVAVVVYQPTGGTPEQREALRDCTTIVQNSDTVTADDCVRMISANPTTDLDGASIGTCLLYPTAEGCGDLEPALPEITTFTLDGNSTSQLNRDELIADCAQAGVSRVDCENVAAANAGSNLTGAQLASCIKGRATNDNLCAGLAGLTNLPPIVSCAKEGSCVEGRTCIAGGTTGLRNIGAACDTSPAPTGSCKPDSDWLSKDGKAGAPCCGGGNQECASSVCNAVSEEVGVCAEIVTGGNTGSSEASTGIATEVRTDCSKTNGMVQGTSSSGFVLKCDFDGNGSFGYHQPTGFIYGQEAAGACKVLCADIKADVEGAARQRYRELQVASGGSSSKANPNSSSATDLNCIAPMFENEFACVSYSKTACAPSEAAKGCFRPVDSVCTESFQKSEGACASFFHGACARNPRTWCFDEKAKVDAINLEFADEIAAAPKEIEASIQVSRNIFQQAAASFQAAVSSFTKGLQDIWSQFNGGTTDSAPNSQDESPTGIGINDGNVQPPVLTEQDLDSEALFLTQNEVDRWTEGESAQGCSSGVWERTECPAGELPSGMCRLIEHNRQRSDGTYEDISGCWVQSVAE